MEPQDNPPKQSLGELVRAEILRSEKEKGNAGDEIVTFDDLVQAAQERDRAARFRIESLNNTSNTPGVVGPKYNPVSDMIRRAGDFAVKMSRGLTGYPRPKPQPRDKFKV